jgi:signal transduction histidine kinase
MYSTPEGGKLTIIMDSASILNRTTESYGLTPGFFVKITVTDTGIGMEKDIIENIFNSFFSADLVNSPEKKGLGLTLAKEIIQYHDGVIDVWSSPGVGSFFSIILPLKKATDSMDIPAEDGKFILGNESVLMVDDDDLILTVGREICK